MLTLSELLYIICEKTNLHVCIHDVSGILQKDKLKIDSYFQRHSKPFCDMAKSSEKGYTTCIKCKDASNKRAVLGEDFSRTCPYGIYEIIRPVIISGKVKCIIYLGNLAKNAETLTKCAFDTCKVNGISPALAKEHISETEDAKDEAYYIRLADFLREFIINLYSEDGSEKNEKTPYHWCVAKICEYAERNYRQNMTLDRLADLYFINEKYLGRIFKKQVGKTFHEYLTELRLKEAVKLLFENRPVNSLAAECGFQSVTYFNRCFKSKYGLSPTEYRKMNQRVNAEK